MMYVPEVQVYFFVARNHRVCPRGGVRVKGGWNGWGVIARRRGCFHVTKQKTPATMESIAGFHYEDIS